MVGNFFICFVCFDFCSFILLCIVYPINKQNHPEKGGFLFEKIPECRVKRGVIGAE